MFDVHFLIILQKTLIRDPSRILAGRRPPRIRDPSSILAGNKPARIARFVYIRGPLSTQSLGPVHTGISRPFNCQARPPVAASPGLPDNPQDRKTTRSIRASRDPFTPMPQPCIAAQTRLRPEHRPGPDGADAPRRHGAGFPRPGRDFQRRHHPAPAVGQAVGPTGSSNCPRRSPALGRPGRTGYGPRQSAGKHSGRQRPKRRRHHRRRLLLDGCMGC